MKGFSNMGTWVDASLGFWSCTGHVYVHVQLCVCACVCVSESEDSFLVCESTCSCELSPGDQWDADRGHELHLGCPYVVSVCVCMCMRSMIWCAWQNGLNGGLNCTIALFDHEVLLAAETDMFIDQYKWLNECWLLWLLKAAWCGMVPSINDRMGRQL